MYDLLPVYFSRCFRGEGANGKDTWDHIRAPRQSPVCALKKDNITIKSVVILTTMRMISVVDMVKEELILSIASFYPLLVVLRYISDR